jgi:hypothetical protein
MSEHRLRRHKVLTSFGVAVPLVLALGGFGYWWKFVRKDEKPVDVQAVEREFAAKNGQKTREGVPVPGVYLYETKGTESVSALGGQSNTYPATTTLTVTLSGCGFDTRWDVITGRFDLNRRCRRPDGTWVLVGTTTSDRFFNDTQADPSRCDAVDLVASPRAGQTWTGKCTDPPNSTTMKYTVLGQEDVQVGDRTVSTWHLRIVTTQGGQRTGGGTEDRWVLPETDLVVRSRWQESDVSPSPVGKVTYEQRYEVALRSLSPRS